MLDYICRCNLCCDYRNRKTIPAGLYAFGFYVTLTALWERAQFGSATSRAALDRDLGNVDKTLAEKRKRYGEHREAYVDGREHRAFYAPTIIDEDYPWQLARDTQYKPLARPRAQVRKPKPMHAYHCDPNCTGFDEGFIDYVNDEQGRVLVYGTARCDCWCHDEPPFGASDTY